MKALASYHKSASPKSVIYRMIVIVDKQYYIIKIEVLRMKTGGIKVHHG